MRKLLMLVTMLLVPTLASAWTLPVKVTNTTAGIAAGNKATVTVGAALTGKDVTAGTTYFYPKNSPLESVKVVVANKANATVSITNADVALVDTTSTDDFATYDIPANAGKTIQSLSVVYASAATAKKANISLTQTPGGLTTLSVGSSSTTSGYTGVLVGTAITVKAQPSTGYTLVGINVNGEAVEATASPYTFTVADEVADSVVATYAKAPVITASLSLPTSGNIGTPVTATVAASTTGTADLAYAWTVNGVAVDSGTFTPVAGANLVYVTVSSADAASVTKTATIQGVDLLAAANYECTSCHSGSTPTVIADYNAGNHGTSAIACVSCHTSTPHAALPTAESAHGNVDTTVVSSCAGCHKSVADAFATSQHGTRQGKATWYNNNIDNPEAVELQKGFGNYVQTAYTALPCGKCHNAAAWTVGGVDTWAAATGGKSVCNDCHGNKAAGVNTTSLQAPVTKATCLGCHSRQANETSAGLTDVHFVAGMGCASCHSTNDMHGTGTQTSSQLQWGTISAQCENCHGEGKDEGPISSIAAHVQHAGDIACSTCHAESMITCHNCHFDNEAGAGGAKQAKFFSGKFGGTAASGNSWRFLVNRVMPDGSTKIYPGSMQSLVADHTVDGLNDGNGHTHAGIAPYYSHTITKVNALSCDKCHGTETAVKLAAGEPVRVTTWNAAAGVAVTAANVATTFVGPKGVIPVPENPRGKLLMDFVDLTNPELGTTSNRVLFQKDGPDSIHMPEAFVKPLTAAQMQKLADVQFDHTSAVATTSASPTGQTADTCNGCHSSTNNVFASSLHGTREGKVTFYDNNLGNAEALPLQKGYGNYVTVDYTDLPCAKCHNAKAWTLGGVDTWPGAPVCTDCHTNRTITNGVLATTAFDAPVTAATCNGCHSRQVNETAMGLTDVHLTAGMTCYGCHGFTDMHGTGAASPTQLADGAVSAKCETCHVAGGSYSGGAPSSAIPEHDSLHLAKIACSTCHMESVITCYNCHFDNEASDPADSTILHAKFASGKFGGTGAASWRFLVNRVMSDGSTKIYPASMQSLVADRTAANAPGEDNQGWTHAAIAPYYSHSITRVNALKCDKCHGIQKAIDLANGVAVRVVKWDPNTTTYPDGIVPVSALGAGYTVKPSGVIPVPENPVGKLLMDFVDLTDPAAGPLNAGGTSPSPRKLFKADGPDSIHMPEAYVKPLTAAQITSLATPQVRP